jgi:hypothetical protein
MVSLGKAEAIRITPTAAMEVFLEFPTTPAVRGGGRSRNLKTLLQQQKIAASSPKILTPNDDHIGGNM